MFTTSTALWRFRVGVQFLVALVERTFDFLDRLGVVGEIADLDGAFVDLSDIAHVEAALDPDRGPREAVGDEVLHALRFDLLEQAVDVVRKPNLQGATDLSPCSCILRPR